MFMTRGLLFAGASILGLGLLASCGVDGLSVSDDGGNGVGHELREPPERIWIEDRPFVREVAVQLSETTEPAEIELTDEDEEHFPSPLEMSLEELAESLRMWTERDGYWYREEFANVELAKQILENPEPELEVGQTTFGKAEGVQDEETGKVCTDGTCQQGLVLGFFDERYQVSNRYHPWRAMVALTKYLDRERPEVAHCSGWMIGPNHMMSAGHCFYTPRADREEGKGDYSQPLISPGADVRSKPSFPAGHFRVGSPAPGDTRPGESCAKLFLPQGFVKKKKVDPHWDFSFVSFKGCSVSPGKVTGTLAITTRKPWGFDRVYTAGYPGDKPVYTIWAESDFASGLSYSSRWTTYGGCSSCIKHLMDTAPGQSGSPLWSTIGGRAAFAIHTAGVPERSPWGTSYNLAKSIDGVVAYTLLHWLLRGG